MKFKVNKYEFTIKEVEWDHEGLFIEKSDTYHWGVCHYIEGIIYLRKDLPTDRKRTVLIHELAHAFIEAHGFYGSEKDEEIVCDLFGYYADQMVDITNKYFGRKNK